MARLTTCWDRESLEIRRSGFDVKPNLTSAIGNLPNCNILVSYVSRLNAMAYDTCPIVEKTLTRIFFNRRDLGGHERGKDSITIKEA